MLDAFRILVSRIFAAVVAMLAASTVRHGIELSPELQSHLVEVLVGISLIVYAVVHKLVSRRFNPADVAKQEG